MASPRNEVTPDCVPFRAFKSSTCVPSSCMCVLIFWVQVLVTMADRNVKQQLWLWHQGIMLSNVTNVMVLALDEETWQFAKRELSLASCVLRGASTQPSTFQNAHEMSSAKKYRLLQRIVRLGYHVLLSDTDVALLDDPFLHLHRDADVECSTDGWSDLTAYGWSSRTKDPPLFPPW